VPVDEHHLLFSATVVAISIVAIVAAFAMAKSYRTAYSVWLVLLGLSIVSFVGYLIVGFVSWGPKATIIPLCWETSYVAAFLLAQCGSDLGSHPSQ
jgi:CBS domain containing-hemolysin-like protein